MEASRQRSGNLQIQTDEGDTVTISFAAAEALRYRSAGVSAGDSSASQTSTQNSSSLNVKVEVKGDLSDQEVADISKLLRRLGGAIRSAGNNETPSRPVGRRGLGSLESFQFAYQESKEVAYSTISVAA